MINITRNTVVSMRYIMRNSNNEILENTMNNLPVKYLHGCADIHPSLQSQIEGLKAGESKRVYLIIDRGTVTDNFIFDVSIDDVREASKEEIMMGSPVKVNASKCEPGCDCYG